MPLKRTFEIKCLTKSVGFHFMCQKKAIYLPRLGERIISFFLCMYKVASSSELSWLWVKPRCHTLACRIACATWLPAPSTCGKGTCHFLFGQLHRLAGQSTPLHLKIAEGRSVLKGHKDTSEREYSEKEKKIKKPFQSNFSQW